ncbi:hypothetical protein [Pseudomonas sp. AG1028]|uniref:hypothetical protein n=1 Tax=Pseudomonas sp. AG1028 TaxID=2572911 RepID=UPI0011BD6BD5|nr:hypothetical protein [Pseudomonas sp. AG1028]
MGVFEPLERPLPMFFIRNLAVPFILIIGGVVAMMGLAILSRQGGAVADWARAMFPWLGVLPALGAVWAARRLVQIWQWRRGTLNGGCSSCTGVMTGGRCRMCGQR